MSETCGLLEEVQLTYHSDLSGTNGFPGCILLLKPGPSQHRQTRRQTAWGVFQVEEEDKGSERRACLAVSATSKEASVAREEISPVVGRDLVIQGLAVDAMQPEPTPQPWCAQPQVLLISLPMFFPGVLPSAVETCLLQVGVSLRKQPVTNDWLRWDYNGLAPCPQPGSTQPGPPPKIDRDLICNLLQFSFSLHLSSLRWCLRCWRICLQCSRCVFDPWVRKMPWRGKWLPLRYSCLRNPMDRGVWWLQSRGYSPWGHKESDTTNNFTFLFSSLQVGFLRALLSKLSSCVSIVESVSNKPKLRQDLKVILRDK